MPPGAGAGSLPTVGAPAAALEVQFDVFLAVVDGDLGAGRDALERAVDHAVALEHGFGIRVAGVVDVAGEVAPRGAVDGPTGVDLEQVLVAAAAVDLLRQPGRDAAAQVFDDLRLLLDRLGGEQAEARGRAADPIGLALRHSGYRLLPVRAARAALRLRATRSSAARLARRLRQREHWQFDLPITFFR